VHPRPACAWPPRARKAVGMRIGMSRMTNVSLFAAWDARLVQHLMLLPVLLVSYWASLRIQWRPLWIALPLQVILGAVFAAIAYPAMLVAEMTMGRENWHETVMQHGSDPWFDPTFLSLWMASFVSFLPTYGFGLALVTGLALYTRFRNSELRLAALEREWSSARLAALRMQLSPHTLFNLLHTIRGQIEWDPKGAQSMVVQLADLLRRLLNAGERDFSRLSDELQFVRLYLELQQRRFADRLSVVLPDAADISAVWVPSLILQPLVENAVVHGLAGHQAPVSVRITVHMARDVLTLRVLNTIAPEKAVGEEGIGCIAFSVLAQGLLTERYLDGIPEGSRASKAGSLTLDMLNDDNLARIRALNDIALQRGQSLAQMAIAWALRDTRVTSVLIGASSVAQLEQNVAALDHLDFTADELATIDRHAVDAGIDLWRTAATA